MQIEQYFFFCWVGSLWGYFFQKSVERLTWRTTGRIWKGPEKLLCHVTYICEDHAGQVLYVHYRGTFSFNSFALRFEHATAELQEQVATLRNWGELRLSHFRHYFKIPASIFRVGLIIVRHVLPLVIHLAVICPGLLPILSLKLPLKWYFVVLSKKNYVFYMQNCFIYTTLSLSKTLSKKMEGKWKSIFKGRVVIVYSSRSNNTWNIFCCKLVRNFKELSTFPLHKLREYVYKISAICKCFWRTYIFLDQLL